MRGQVFQSSHTAPAHPSGWRAETQHRDLKKETILDLLQQNGQLLLVPTASLIFVFKRKIA